MRTLTAALALACLGGAAHAQGPAAWARLAVPGGTASAQVQSLGKLVVAQLQDVVHVYSAATRQWHAHPAPGAPPLRLANDWLLWRDGTGFVAFSSMRGTFERLAASPAAIVVNPNNQRNDSIVLVRDGTQLHHFSGFDGHWRTRSIGLNAGVAVQRHVAIVTDGNLLGGLGAFAPGWVDAAAAGPATMLSADGTAAVAVVGGTVHGFAASGSSWSSTSALSPGASFVRGDDWALWHDGTTALAFSGLRGGFQAAPVGTVGEMAVQEDLVGLRSGVAVSLYSPVTGTWTLAGLGLTGSMVASTTVALLADGPNLQAYSALRGTVSPLALDTSGFALSGTVAAALPRSGSAPWLFSSLLGQWVQAPADVQGALPTLASQSALLPTATGWRGWSARTGNSVPLPVQGTPVANPSSAITAIWNATNLHVFDARREAWLSVPRSGPGTPSLQAWRTTLAGHDGATALGYGALSGRLEATILLEPALSVTAASECGVVTTAAALHAWSSVAEAGPLAQFPEFRRIQATGSPCRIQLQLGNAPAAVLGIGSLAPAATQLPGIGSLLLDPATTGTVLCLPAPGETRHLLDVQVPATPSLRGTRWWFQALVAPPAGAAGPWLTDGTELMPW